MENPDQVSNFDKKLRILKKSNQIFKSALYFIKNELNLKRPSKDKRKLKDYYNCNAIWLHRTSAYATLFSFLYRRQQWASVLWTCYRPPTCTFHIGHSISPSPAGGFYVFTYLHILEMLRQRNSTIKNFIEKTRNKQNFCYISRSSCLRYTIDSSFQKMAFIFCKMFLSKNFLTATYQLGKCI